MTQIQHVTAKEMTRRTGVRNALGYTFPEKNLILLKKGLKGKKKREVLDHEINHLRRGEEGPFLGRLIDSLTGGDVLGAGLSLLGGRSAARGQQAGMEELKRQNALAQSYLAPYREFGAQQLGGLGDWLRQAGYTYQQPTMEEVMATPGYETRLGPIESSAAARGGLLSGNALRNIGEFGASEFERERQRRMQDYQQQLANRLGLVGLGSGAAGQSAQFASQLGSQLAGLQQGLGQTRSGMFGDIAGIVGQVQGRQNWQDFLSAAYPGQQ